MYDTESVQKYCIGCIHVCCVYVCIRSCNACVKISTPDYSSRGSNSQTRVPLIVVTHGDDS